MKPFYAILSPRPPQPFPYLSHFLTSYSTVSFPCFHTFGLKSRYTNYIPLAPHHHHPPHSLRTFTYLSLLRRPLPIRIPIVHNLITARIPHLNRGMRECSFGAPFDVIASALLDEEGGCAALVSVCIDALLDCVVKDFA